MERNDFRLEAQSRPKNDRDARTVARTYDFDLVRTNCEIIKYIDEMTFKRNEMTNKNERTLFMVGKPRIVSPVPVG